MWNRKMKGEFKYSKLTQPKYDFIKMVPSPYMQHFASVDNYKDKVFALIVFMAYVFSFEYLIPRLLPPQSQ